MIVTEVNDLALDLDLDPDVRIHVTGTINIDVGVGIDVDVDADADADTNLDADTNADANVIQIQLGSALQESRPHVCEMPDCSAVSFSYSIFEFIQSYIKYLLSFDFIVEFYFESGSPWSYSYSLYWTKFEYSPI